MHPVMQSFLSNKDRIAIIDEKGNEKKYQDIIERIAEIGSFFPEKKQLIAIEAADTFDSICVYLFSIVHGHAALMVPEGSEGKMERIYNEYKPNFYVTNNSGKLSIQQGNTDTVPLHPDLAVLLSTSGTTGTPKLVKLSLKNVRANAASIHEYLKIDPDDRAATTLPYHYSYGLSVLNSHIFYGASLAIISDSVAEAGFWEKFKELSCTSFAGVPYSYELIANSGFEEMDIPSLKYFTQAGGRLSKELVSEFSKVAKAKNALFYVMYGQTEATARMSYLPPEHLETHPDKIGIAIPGGRFLITDENSNDITDSGKPGELVYYGDNVMMGYASVQDDLASAPELECLKTGDIAVYLDGMFKIVGRTKSFVKIFGLRINLDDIEIQLSSLGVQSIVTGDDDLITIAITNEEDRSTASSFMINTIKIPGYKFAIVNYAALPQLPSGKVDKKTIQADGKSQSEKHNNHATAEGSKTDQLISLYSKTLGKDVSEEDSFNSLKGDSLSYVAVQVGIEKILGHAPVDWEKAPLGHLAESKSKSKRNFPSVSSEVLFRALAITSVVVVHSQLFATHGGSEILILLAGYSLSRFQSDRLANGHIFELISSLFTKIMLPYYLILIAYLVYKQDFYWPALIFSSNYFGGYNNWEGSFLSPFWFLEIYFQIIVLISLIFLNGKVRSFYRTRPFETAATITGLSIIALITGHAIFDTTAQLDRVLYMWLYIFMFGWLIHLAKSSVQKALVMAAFSVLALVYIVPEKEAIQAMIVCAGVLWIPSIPVMQKWIATIINAVGSSSFYIYMTHSVPITFIYWRNVEKFNPDMLSVLSIVAALIFGVIVKKAVEKVNFSAIWPKSTTSKSVVE